MTWNNRVISRIAEDEYKTRFLSIYEVYYDDNGKAYACTSEPVAPQGDTLEELRKEIERFAKATELPVLNYEDFTTKH